jgi:hypothetical protein
MNALEKEALQSLRSTLVRKAYDEQIRSNAANISDNPTQALFYDGIISGYWNSIIELDAVLNILEKE